MWWLIPLGLTILATSGLVTFLVTAEGEDIMAGSIVMAIWAFITFGSWAIYGLIRLLLWVAS